MKSRAQYFPELTGIRAFAAAWVFFFHYRGMYLEISRPDLDYWRVEGAHPLSEIVRHGHLGVPVFFALSGFLIPYIYAQRTRFSGASDFGRYYLRRFARIFPLYYFVLFLSYMARYTQTGATPDFSVLPFELTLTHALFEDIQFSGVSTAWTLTIEECFYLFAPLLFPLVIAFAASGRNVRLIGTLVLYGVGLFALAYGLSYVVPAYKGFLASGSFIMGSTFFGRAIEFFTGVVVAAFVLKRGATKNETSLRGESRALSLLSWLCVIGMALVAYSMKYDLGYLTAPGVITNTLVAALSALLIYCLVTNRGSLNKVLASKPIEYFGKISFALYLLHPARFLARKFFQVSQSVFTEGIAREVLYYVIAYLVVSIGAAIAYHVVEKPCHKAITRFAK